jgi:hypothetical protein
VDGVTCDEVYQVSTDNGQPIRPVAEIDASLVPLSTVRTAADFAECLDQVRVLAGPLSHREIESRSGGRLRRTKIGQVLGGELPHREFLTVYLEVCGVSEATSESWHRIWTRLVSTARSPSRPAARIAEAGDALVLRRERDAALARIQRLTDELKSLRSATRTADAACTADVERAAVTARAGEPGGLNGSVIDEIQTLRAERDAANRHARRLGELNESTVERLRTAETARDEALEHVRLLSRELDAAQAQIAELTNTVARWRNDLTGDDTELELARQEIVRLRGLLDRGGGEAYTARRLAKYTQKEANDIYGANAATLSPIPDEG